MYVESNLTSGTSYRLYISSRNGAGHGVKFPAVSANYAFIIEAVEDGAVNEQGLAWLYVPGKPFSWSHVDGINFYAGQYNAFLITLYLDAAFTPAADLQIWVEFPLDTTTAGDAFLKDLDTGKAASDESLVDCPVDSTNTYSGTLTCRLITSDLKPMIVA